MRYHLERRVMKRKDRPGRWRPVLQSDGRTPMIYDEPVKAEIMMARMGDVAAARSWDMRIREDAVG